MDGLGGLDLKTIRQEEFSIWASKTGARPARPDFGDGRYIAPSQSFHRGEAKS